MKIISIEKHSQIALIEKRITFSNYAISISGGFAQHVLLEQVFYKTNWAFLGNGNLTLSVITTVICLALFSGQKFKSIFLFMSGLEHYAFIVRRVFLLISLLVFLIFALSLPGGRNFILICLIFQTILWLTARKILSILVKRKIKKLKVVILSDRKFVSEYFHKTFEKLNVVENFVISQKTHEDIDLVLFHNFSQFDLKHFVMISQLQDQGIISGYLTNEIRLQGWSGIQVLIGPHLMMINSNYNNVLFMRIWKRVFDLIATFSVLIVFSPLLIFFGCFSISSNWRSIFYIQDRLGQNGEIFKILKFRTLKQSSVSGKNEMDLEEGWVRKPRKDELVPLGHLMRRWSIDELPQLLNVVLGKMSLVGPRPRLPAEVDEVYRLVSPIFTKNLKPGITGLWQISGRNELDSQFALVLDKYYVDHWNPFMDMLIILKTVGALINGVGAK